MIVSGPMAKTRGQLVDQALDNAAALMLRHDDRIRRLDVRVRFDGGVAHVDGQVVHPQELACLRELLAGLSGVLAVWDRVVVAGRRPRIVDLGAGDTKQYRENVGIDRRAAGAADVVADISRTLPLASSSVDQVFMVHVLEHLLEYLPVLDECYRVLRPGGALHVMSPHWRHVNAVADPTHLRFFDVQTFKHFCVARPGAPAPRWYPLCVSTDGASVFADLVPVKSDRQPADDIQIARFFD
jgi:SAM-dependent methyltransferase